MHENPYRDFFCWSIFMPLKHWCMKSLVYRLSFYYHIYKETEVTNEREVKKTEIILSFMVVDSFYVIPENFTRSR